MRSRAFCFLASARRSCAPPLALVLGLCLGPSGTAGACGEQACASRFHLEEVREVRLADGGYLREASGLTAFGGFLWAVSDKSDAAIYRLELSPERTLAAAREVPLHIPAPIRDALTACRSHRGKRLDLEGIAVDDTGRFVLLSENYRALLITAVEDPDGSAPRGTVRDVLCVPGRNRSSNDGLEGLSAFSGGILALEEGRGWPMRRLYRCRLPDRRCDPLPFPILSGRTPDLTVLDPEGRRLLVLMTAWGAGNDSDRICEVRVDDAGPPTCILSFDRAKEAAKTQATVPDSFRRDGGTNYEGIFFDAAAGRLYVINDNNAAWNQMLFGDADGEPTLLLIFGLDRPPPAAP